MGRNPALTIGLAAALAAAALGGALLGAFLVRAPGGETLREPEAARPVQTRAPGLSAPSPGDEELAMLLGVLIDEVRALRTSLAATRRAAAAPGGPGGGEPEGAGDEPLIEALNALSRAVRAAPAGRGAAAPVLVVPDRPARLDLLLSRTDVLDDFERVRPYLFLTYQQALDRFGPPTEVHSVNDWFYRDPATGQEVYLGFEEGLLIRIN